MVRVVTDSAAELDPEVVNDLGIVVVPWRLQLGTDTMQDGPTFRRAQAYRDLARHKVLPVPLPPDARHFAETFSSLSRDTDDIVSIHCSSRLSKVVASAHQGRSRLLGRCQVHVIDTMFISRAQGLLVEAAARAALDGMPGAEIVRYVNGLMPRVYFAFHVDRMEHLSRSGLIMDGRSTSTGLARVLLMLEDGHIISFRRSRSRGTPVDRLMEFIVEFQGLEELYIIHSGLTSGARDLSRRLDEELPTQGYSEHIYGPVLYNYLGPTALGIVAFEG